MALAPGPAAVFRIVPPATRLLSGRRCGGCCPPARPPVQSSVEEMLEESLRGEHPAGPVRPGGCSSSLAPPQDRENCHVGGNAFVLFDGFELVTLYNICLQRAMKFSSPSRRGRPKVYGWAPPLQGILVLECVKYPPWGRVSAPAGVAPEALEECLHSSKGCKRRPTWLLH